jgi:pimeloyl-ACP methyl ester carboxylesterase
MRFDAHTFEADGVRMRYFTGGLGPPLLFLHGGGVKAMTYRKNLELLAERYFVIAPDVPPFGGSSIPKEVWDFNDYGRYFSAFLDALQVNDVTVLGHSYGGGIALCLAAQSKRVGRLIVVDAAGISQPPLGMFIYQYFFRKTFHNLLQKNFGVFTRIHIDFLTNLVKKLPQIVCGVRIVFHAMQPRYSGTIARVAVPTLILWGEDDEIFPASTAACLHELIKSSELRIVPGNHDWCLFQPQKLPSLL